MKLYRRLLCLYVSLVAGCFLTLFGCGGSGSGGVTQPPPKTPDFSLAINPASASVNVPAGETSPSISLSMTALYGFAGNVTITSTLPSGIACVSQNCGSGTLSPGAGLTFQYAAAKTMSPGALSVTYTGTSGSLTHTVKLTINITAAPAIPVNSSGFVFTGDPFPPSRGVTYDAVHNQIFVSNMQLNEVEVIAPETLRITQRIPVPSPAGLDMSPDNSMLYVGTSTENFYEIDTTALHVVKRVPFPGLPSAEEDYPTQIVSMADGNLMMVAGCGIINPCTTGTAVVTYSPSTGTQTVLPLNGFSDFPGSIVPSPDREHVYIESADDAGDIGRYDVATQTFTAGKPLMGNLFSLAVKPDGSQLAVVVNCCQISFLDKNMNVLGTYSPGFLKGLQYSGDGKSLFAQGESTGGSSLEVVDATTFKPIGQVPSMGNGPAISAMDGTGRVLGLGTEGLDALDVSMTPAQLSATAPFIGGSSLLTPDNSANGYATTLNGANFSGTPTVTFEGVAATDVNVTSSNTITVTAPALIAASQVDVAAYFADGYYSIAPLAYSYSPTVLYMDGNSGGIKGGSLLTIYGRGLDFAADQITVTVGGNAVADLKVISGADTSSIVPLQTITATVPAGVLGNADVVVTTPIGSTTVSRGFTYFQRTDAALEASPSPFDMVLDKTRNQLIWTDSNSAQLVVYSTASNKITQQVSTGAGSVPSGIALTPDGSKLLVVLFGKKKLNVYDAGTLTLEQQISTPAIDDNLPYNPVFIVACANQKAFLMQTVDGYGVVPVSELDLSTGLFTTRSERLADQSSLEAASSDGSTAFVGAGIWNASTDQFLIPVNSNWDSSRALSSDGAVLEEYRAVFSPQATLMGIVTLQSVLQTDLDLNNIPGVRVNATGSLAYLPEVDRIRVFDIRHGRLARTIMLPDGLNNFAISSLAVDPDGQMLYVLTNATVSALQFANDPLAVGEITVNGNLVTVSGSGFTSGAQVAVDGKTVASSEPDSQHLTFTATSYLSNGHVLTITLPSGDVYSLDNAFDAVGPATEERGSDAKLTLSRKATIPTHESLESARRIAQLRKYETTAR